MKAGRITICCLTLLVMAGFCAAQSAIISVSRPPIEHDEQAIRMNPRDGARMVLIPAGEFLMGSSTGQIAALLQAHPHYKREWFTAELPQHKVLLDAYYIYQNDVTVAQYRQFCAATGRQMPPTPPWGWCDQHPIVNVTWADAEGLRGVGRRGAAQ